MKITFVGISGGRVLTSIQRPGFSTGGFHLSLHSTSIYVDPGPSALCKARRFKIPLEGTQHLFLSHNHLDHVSDAMALAEAMNGLGFKKKAHLLASGSVLSSDWSPLSPYHRGLFLSERALKAGDVVNLSPLAELTATETRHDIEGVGFLLKEGSMTLYYSSDTAPFENLPKYLESADVAVLNTIKPFSSTKKHLSLRDALDILMKLDRPPILIPYHFGFRILRFYSKVKEMLAEAEASGIRHVWPKEGATVDLEKLIRGR